MKIDLLERPLVLASPKAAVKPRSSHGFMDREKKREERLKGLFGSYLRTRGRVEWWRLERALKMHRYYYDWCIMLCIKQFLPINFGIFA